MKNISASTAALPLGNVCVTKTPLHCHTDTHYIHYHPPSPPAVPVKDALPTQLPPSGRTGGWCRVTPDSEDHQAIPQTPPPPIHTHTHITPPTQLTQLRPLDRHLTGMLLLQGASARSRVVLVMVGESVSTFSPVCTWEEKVGGGNRRRSIRVINKRILIWLSWLQLHSANWERKEISQYVGGALGAGGGREEGKRKSAVIHVNTCWPPSSLLEY